MQPPWCFDEFFRCDSNLFDIISAKCLGLRKWLKLCKWLCRQRFVPSMETFKKLCLGRSILLKFVSCLFLWAKKYKIRVAGQKFNISSVVEFQRWWVLKSKIFGQESTYSKEFFWKNPLMNYGSSKSAKIVLSKSIFNVKNQPNFFKKEFI